MGTVFILIILLAFAAIALFNLIVGIQLLKTAEKPYTPYLFIVPSSIVILVELGFLIVNYDYIFDNTTIG